MADEISPELQEQIRQLQGMSGQLQQLAQQRQQMEAMKFDADQAMEALADLPADHILYRNIGSLLVKDSVADAKARLGDETETLEIRLKRMTNQETQLKDAAKELQAKLQTALPG